MIGLVRTSAMIDPPDVNRVKLVGHSPTFESFVAALPGVLPDEALSALRRIGGPNAERLAADAATDRAGDLIDHVVLAVAHRTAELRGPSRGMPYRTKFRRFTWDWRCIP